MASTSPLRKIDTGPSSLTAMTVARIVVAVTTRGRVTGPSERIDAAFCGLTRNEPHPKFTEHTFRVEDRRTVDLLEGMTQWREMGGGADSKGRRDRESLLDRRTGFTVRPVDEQGADVQRPEIVDRELQHVLDHERVAVRLAADD